MKSLKDEKGLFLMIEEAQTSSKLRVQLLFERLRAVQRRNQV